MDLSQLSLRTGARLGVWCWIVAAPLFFAANVITGLGWHHPAYSWANDNISDLGNVHCGIWDTTRPRQVCSPWHPLMNTSLVLTAVLLAAGLILTWRTLGHGFVVRLAQSLLLLAAVGYVLPGRFPADVNENLHFLGALMIMVLGNLGLPLAGFAPRATVLGRLRVLTLIAGVTALAGSVLFFRQQGLGIGVGAMERVAVFPLTVWCFCVGIILLAKTDRARNSRGSRPASRAADRASRAAG